MDCCSVAILAVPGFWNQPQIANQGTAVYSTSVLASFYSYLVNRSFPFLVTVQCTVQITAPRPQQFTIIFTSNSICSDTLVKKGKNYPKSDYLNILLICRKCNKKGTI